MSHLRILTWLFAVYSSLGVSAGCKTDADCNLNGVCTPSNSCQCDFGWRAADCGELDVRPAKRDSGYNVTSSGTSSWGSKIVQDPNDQELYHLFAAEFTHGCGLDYWSPYSRVIRGESRSGPAGPYIYAAEIVGTFAHNPTVVFSPADRQYLLYYIGCPYVPSDKCTGPQFSCGPGNNINGESGVSVASSFDLINWTLHGQVFNGTNNMGQGGWDADTTNPSPLPLYNAGNGTSEILLAYRGCAYNCSSTTINPDGEVLSLASAPSFKGPYTRLNHHQPIFGEPNEDPFIWQDKRGNFHLLMHSLEADGAFGNGPKVGRHAYSESIEGPWTFNNNTLAFSTSVEYNDGTTIDFFRRERPQLWFDEGGLPKMLSTGVQEVGQKSSYSVIVPIGCDD